MRGKGKRKRKSGPEEIKRGGGKEGIVGGDTERAKTSEKAQKRFGKAEQIERKGMTGTDGRRE